MGKYVDNEQKQCKSNHNIVILYILVFIVHKTSWVFFCNIN